MDTGLDRIMKKMEKLRENTKSNMMSNNYECPICQDREWITITTESGNEGVIPCECQAEKEYKRLLRISGMPTQYLNMTFQNFKENNNNKAVKEKCIEYLKEDDKTLLLMGQVGSGKTHLASAVVNELLKQGKMVYLMLYRDIITGLKMNMTNQEEYQKQINKMKEVDVLYIDDLFKGRITEADINIIYEVVNHRYVSRKPMIITTEKTIEDLLEIDEAIGSRLYELSKNYVIKMKDGNRRLS